MKKLAISLLAATMLFSASGCSKRKTHRKEHVKVYHLQDGRYCYKHHDLKHGDKWYWLVKTGGKIAKAAGQAMEDVDLDDFVTADGIDLDDIRGAAWVSADTARVESTPTSAEMTQIQQIEVAGSAIQQIVVTDARGMPEVDADGNLVDPDQLAPDQSYDAPNDNSDMASGDSSMGDSSSSDGGSSSSSDGGGGDSGGGGDGGGGGDA